MSIEKILMDRSGGQCELSAATEELVVYPVPPVEGESADRAILVTRQMLDQINAEELEPNLLRGLNDAMWSQTPPVQVMAWRLLTRLSKQGETWAQDLLDMLYLDDETLKWAESGLTSEEDKVVHLDCNGARLEAGDSVSIIKDLPVKGSSMVVKQGTMVRNIGLAHDDPDLFSGKVEGQSIWLRCEFARKK